MLIQSIPQSSRNVSRSAGPMSARWTSSASNLCAESHAHSAAMARWYDALIIATSSMSDISRLSLSAASQSGFSALRTLSLTVIGWPSSSVIPKVTVAAPCFSLIEALVG
jgi:hypothetical protein